MAVNRGHDDHDDHHRNDDRYAWPYVREHRPRSVSEDAIESISIYAAGDGQASWPTTAAIKIYAPIWNAPSTSITSASTASMPRSAGESVRIQLVSCTVSACPAGAGNRSGNARLLSAPRLPTSCSRSVPVRPGER